MPLPVKHKDTHVPDVREIKDGWRNLFEGHIYNYP